MRYTARNAVLNGISFTVSPAEFVAILGANGCGKTTLLHIIAGFLRPTAGTVRIEGKPVSVPGPDRPLIRQDLGLFHWLPVWENLMFGLRARGTHPSLAEETAQQWLSKLALGDFTAHYPFELSGGMQQKLAIGRALILDPKVLLMDEPFANLDFQTREHMQEEIASLTAESGKTVLMVTHSIDEAIFLADRIIVLGERPARIRGIIPIRMPQPRRPEFRLQPEFLNAKRQIMELLNQTPQRRDIYATAM